MYIYAPDAALLYNLFHDSRSTSSSCSHIIIKWYGSCKACDKLHSSAHAATTSGKVQQYLWTLTHVQSIHVQLRIMHVVDNRVYSHPITKHPTHVGYACSQSSCLGPNCMLQSSSLVLSSYYLLCSSSSSPFGGFLCGLSEVDFSGPDME